MNIPTDHNLVKWMQKTFSKRLEGYERILSTTKYLAGDKMTLADLFHVPLMHAVLDVSSTKPCPADVADWRSPGSEGEQIPGGQEMGRGADGAQVLAGHTFAGGRVQQAAWDRNGGSSGKGVMQLWDGEV